MNIVEDTSLKNIALDIAGLIPGIGEAADLANAIDYLKKGDYLFAALSLVSMIPQIGDAVGKGGKLGATLAKKSPKTAKFLAKHGKKFSKHAKQIAQDIKEMREAIIRHEQEINMMIDKLGENEKIKPHIPRIKEALQILTKEGGLEDAIRGNAESVQAEGFIKEFFGLNKNKNRHGGTAMGGFNAPRTLQSLPPRPVTMSGQHGEPSTSPTFSYNRIAKQTMNDDDIKYWAGDPEDPEDQGATFDPPIRWKRFFSDYGDPDDQVYGENMKILKQVIRETFIAEMEPEKEEESQDEASAVAGIAGHIGPLGHDNRSPYLEKGKKKKKSYQSAMDSFGGGKEVD